MDMTFARELFNNVLNSTKLLGMEEDDLCLRMRDALSRLSPYKISKFGTLQEWFEDYEECTPGMGHVSHLYSVYPASIINERDFPEEYKAAYLSLQRRIAHCGMNTDWPGAWAMCLGRDSTTANCVLACLHLFRLISVRTCLLRTPSR